MKSRTFLDTNVLVYAHDLDAGNEHSIAKNTVAEGRIYKLGGAMQVYYVSLLGKNTLAHSFPPPTG
jgi:hypothetical protein